MTYEYFGEMRTHDLITGGGEIVVTNENRERYVRMLWFHSTWFHYAPFLRNLLRIGTFDCPPGIRSNPVLILTLSSWFVRSQQWSLESHVELSMHALHLCDKENPVPTPLMHHVTHSKM